MLIKSVGVYEKIIVHVPSSEVLNLCYKIQAMHYEQHLQLLRQSIKTYKTPINFDTEALMQKMDEYKQIVQNLQDPNMNQEQLMSMLGGVNFSMISGIVE